MNHGTLTLTGWIFFMSFIFLPKLSSATPTPPIASPQPKKLETHGDVRTDPYYWLRNKEDPAVIQYLKDENSYTAAITKPWEPLRKKLFKEMRARVREKDQSYPVKIGNYMYYTRQEKGQQYNIHCRKAILQNGEGKEEVLLDENQLAKKHSYLEVSEVEISDDGSLMAYAADFSGNRLHNIYIKNLKSGKFVGNPIEGASTDLAWSEDGKFLFYIKMTQPDLRDRWVYRKNIETGDEQIVYDETDEKFSVGIDRSRTKKFIFIVSSSKDTSEVYFLEASKPESKPMLFSKREDQIKYDVSESDDSFYIRTNWKAENFRLMKTSFDQTERSNWKEVIPAKSDSFLEGALAFPERLVVLERSNGISQFRILDLKTNQSKPIPMKETVFSVSFYSNPEFDSKVLLYTYNSLTTPNSIYGYDFSTEKISLKKQYSPSGKYNPEDYVTDRIWATSHDGTKVPISIVYKKTTKLNAGTPLLLYGYGSYGYKMDPYFSFARLSLLDRGFVYAMAHIRGGTDLGYPWYLDGKLLKKKNTFLDFIACTEFLHQQKISSPKHTAIMGESAGGMLVGVSVNMRPDLFNAAILGVPFLDVLTDMLDSKLPLTVGEYVEWGNPEDKTYYEYIKSYSPYDNIKKTNYPSMFITAGLNDSQVFFWEPAKWVAKLRVSKTDKNLLLLKTEMETGHAGQSGRYDYLHEVARKFSFLLVMEGIKK